MARNKYTAEQKEAVVARASEIGITAAAKEFGIDRQTISRWKKTAENVQGEVKTETKAEEPAEKIEKATVPELITAEKIISGAADAKAVIQEKVGDAVAVAQSEIKKAARKAKRVVKDTTKKVKESAEQTAKKVRAANVKMIFETNAGQQITTEAIAERIPKGVDAAYIKLEENKIYWVKGEETGSVDIW